MILAIILWAAQHIAKAADVHRVYVIGNNEASSLVRRKITETADKFGTEACFSLMRKPQFADGTLTVEQQETSGGVNALTSILGSGSTTVVSAELSAKDGSVLWQESKQGMPGITSTGAAGGANRVLEALYRSSGCDKRGRRQ